MASSQDIQGWYNQYLGRSASDDEVNNWLNGTYGNDPYGQIKNSGEAQSYAARQATLNGIGGDTVSATTAPHTGVPTDSGSRNTTDQSPVTQDSGGPSATTANTQPQASYTGDVQTHQQGSASAPSTGTQPTFDQINALYQQFLGRPASQQEYTNWINGTYTGTPNDLNAISSQIQNSGEAQAHAAAGTSTGTASGDVTSLVKNALASVKSTDDPNYWIQKISADPNMQNASTRDSAWQYWLDRIRRGDGSALVANGTLTKFNDGGAATTSGATSTAAPSTGYTSPTTTSNVGGGYINLFGNGTNTGMGASSADSLYNQAMRLFMMNQLGQLSGPTTADDPTIAGAINANNVQSMRDQQATRDALAERAYATGGGSALDSGGFSNQLTANAENAANQRASFAGNAVYQQALNKRQQLQAMLQTAVNAGLTEQAQQIQQQINLINAQLTQASINNTFANNNNNLAYQYAALLAGLNRDTTLAGLGSTNVGG